MVPYDLAAACSGDGEYQATARDGRSPLLSLCLADYTCRMSHVVAAPKAAVAATNPITMATMKSYSLSHARLAAATVSGGTS